MVLIFLSGAPVSAGTKLYVNNILNTLFLPAGAWNQYRFARAGDHINVDPDLIPRLERFAAKWRKEQVLLTFVDRYAAGGYQFRPLRRGRLTNAYTEGNRLFCEAELGDYIAVDGNFADWLQENAHGANYPHLVGNDPNNHNDGHYVVHTSAAWTSLPIVATGDQLWTEHVDALAKTHRFQNPPNHNFFFFRADVPRPTGGGTFSAKKGRFKVPSNSRFELQLSYSWPFGAASVPNTLFKVIHNKSLQSDVDEMQVANPFNLTVINYKTAKIPDEDEVKIELAGDPDQNLFRPNAPVLLTIGLSGRQVVWGLLGFVAVVVGSAVTTSSGLSLGDFWDFHSLLAHFDWIKLGGEALKLFGLVFLLIIFGRKIT